MKKRTFFAVLVSVLCLFLILCENMIGFSAFAAYNDPWVEEYDNMKLTTKNESSVPTLFKNDSAFINDKRFPLVVQNNVQYVPLEMFTGLSGIKTVTNSQTMDFYITNIKNQSYISFDVGNDMVTTHEFKTYKLETKLFFQTRYLPAKEIAEFLGLSAEIYESKEKGIYALRLTDGSAKLSFSELIKNYTPITSSDSKPNDTETSDSTSTHEKHDPKPEKDKDPEKDHTTEDPEKQEKPDIGQMEIFVTVDCDRIEYIPQILNSLGRTNIKALFFIRPGDILLYPDNVRSILAEGYSVGFLLDAAKPEESFFEAKENFLLVTKRTSHLIRFEGGSGNAAITDELLSEFLSENALRIWDYNVNSREGPDMYDNLYGSMLTLSQSMNMYRAKAVLRLSCGPYTGDALMKLSSIVRTKSQLSFGTANDTADALAYR